ncbi:MAG TPA: type II CAAX endopeptidase family protein [Tepidisphaeraceae bacterium]|jgi:membrane protease YdiL (CAAX protease family)|nr:type II CAAX endopeptidase family protein [Tepidisphaeraceae bacterium]
MSILDDGGLEGPPPREAGENAGTLMGIALAGMLTYWIVVPAVYQILAGKAFAPASQPATQAIESISPHDLLVLSIASPIVGFIVLVVGNLLWRKNAFERLGFTLPRLREDGWKAGIAVIIILPMMFGVVDLTGRLWDRLHFSHPNEHELLHILGGESNAGVRAAIVFSAIVLAPLFEELFFRGMLQSACEKMLDRTPGPVQRWAAIVAASMAFTAVHEPWMMPPIFFLSICLGYAYDRTKNLWVPMIVHASFNAVSVAMFLFLR